MRCEILYLQAIQQSDELCGMQCYGLKLSHLLTAAGILRRGHDDTATSTHDV